MEKDFSMLEHENASMDSMDIWNADDEKNTESEWNATASTAWNATASTVWNATASTVWNATASTVWNATALKN